MSYSWHIYRGLRILLNVCHQFREDMNLVDVPLTVLVLDPGSKRWRSIDARNLGLVIVRRKTSPTLYEAKQRVEEQVEGLSGCTVSGGKEHHFGVMYFPEKPEMGVKVFKKETAIGSGEFILGVDELKDRPTEGVAKGIPVGLLAGVEVKRILVAAPL